MFIELTIPLQFPHPGHSMKYDPVFSSTPKDKRPQKTQLDSAYTKALSTIGQSKSVARQFSGKPASKGVKRLGKRGPIAKGMFIDMYKQLLVCSLHINMPYGDNNYSRYGYM